MLISKRRKKGKDETESQQGRMTRIMNVDNARLDAFCKEHGIFKSTFFTAVYSYLLAKFNNEQEALFNTIYKGLGIGDAVSVIIPRCEWMAIASLGVLKAGCAYQPLDPSYPKERLNFMVKDADAKLLIADEELRDLVDEYQGEVLLTKEFLQLPSLTAETNSKLSTLNSQET